MSVHACRFFRMRVAELERFQSMVTVDMHAHFTAVAEQQHATLQQEQQMHDTYPGKTTAPPGYPPVGGGNPLTPRTPPKGYPVASPIAEGYTPSDGLDTFNIELPRDAHGSVHEPHAYVSANVAEGPDTQGLSRGRVVQESMGDSLCELQQHRGVYARLGCVVPVMHAARVGTPAQGSHFDRGTESSSAESPAETRSISKWVKTAALPMELQVRFFCCVCMLAQPRCSLQRIS
jgi:hypothetical protein